MTIGRGSFLNELVERAGGVNLFEDVTSSAGTVSIEAVASRDPDLILTTTAGPAAFAERPEWQAVRAVRERRFLPVTGSEFNRPSPRAPAAIRELTRQASAGRLMEPREWPGLAARRAPDARDRARGRDGAARLGEVWAGLWHADASGAVIVRDLRAPRVLLAFCVGGSLAVCGAALQAMIRNPLAEPYLLGLSGGAGLGAVIAIATRAAGPWAVPVAAFVGAIAAVALVYRLSLVAGRRLDPRVLLLSGVVVGSFAGRPHERDHRALALGRHPERLSLAARRVRLGIVADAGGLRRVRRAAPRRDRRSARGASTSSPSVRSRPTISAPRWIARAGWSTCARPC